MTAPVLRPLRLPLTALLSITDSPDWTGARCAGDDAEHWFPFPTEPFDHAASVCAGCPLRGRCRAFAEANGETGVWGGIRYNNGRVVPG